MQQRFGWFIADILIEPCSSGCRQIKLTICLIRTNRGCSYEIPLHISGRINPQINNSGINQSAETLLRFLLINIEQFNQPPVRRIFKLGASLFIQNWVVPHIVSVKAIHSGGGRKKSVLWTDGASRRVPKKRMKSDATWMLSFRNKTGGKQEDMFSAAAILDEWIKQNQEVHVRLEEFNWLLWFLISWLRLTPLHCIASDVSTGNGAVSRISSEIHICPRYEKLPQQKIHSHTEHCVEHTYKVWRESERPWHKYPLVSAN